MSSVPAALPVAARGDLARAGAVVITNVGAASAVGQVGNAALGVLVLGLGQGKSAGGGEEGEKSGGRELHFG